MPSSAGAENILSMDNGVCANPFALTQSNKASIFFIIIVRLLNLPDSVEHDREDTK